MAIKRKVLIGRVKAIDRFNKSPENTEFLRKFQEVMIQRLNLNHIDKYHIDNVHKIIKSVAQLPAKGINTNITDGFTLSCNIEPELYINIQETAKKITGNFLPIDELIHLLLTYFCHIYKDNLPKNVLPFKHINKGKRFSKLLLFQNRFKKYYSNTVHNFME